MFVVANQWFFVVARYADRLSHVLHSYVQMNGKRSVVNGYIGTANNGRYLIYFHGLPIANIDFSLGSLFTGKEKMVHPIILIASPERSLHKMMSRRGRPSDHQLHRSIPLIGACLIFRSLLNPHFSSQPHLCLLNQTLCWRISITPLVVLKSSTGLYTCRKNPSVWARRPLMQHTKRLAKAILRRRKKKRVVKGDE